MMKTPGRNDPCRCGSGKKLKNCCLGKKSRRYKLSFDFGSPVAVDRIIQTQDGHFFLADNHGSHKPNSMILDHGYERESSKFKTLQRAFGQNRISDSNAKLTPYFRCYAIDTNTKIIGNVQTSITGVVMGEFNDIYP